jgi:hypothetical protein
VRVKDLYKRRQVCSILLVAAIRLQTLVVPTQAIKEELKRSLKNKYNTGKQSCFYFVPLCEICHCLLLVKHKT